jgi:SPP1 family predicted phage head-tail adaptor
MRYGRLDRRVTLERKATSLSLSGEETETWSTLATRWAAVETPTGDEKFSNPQLVAKQQQEFLVRWSSDIADLSPLDRLSYNGSAYDIHAVSEVGRREALKIIATRRAD